MHDDILRAMLKKGTFSGDLYRYTFVGGIAFIVDFTTLYLLKDFLALNYLLAAAIGFILGLIINYLLSIYWVFNHRKLANRWHELAIFSIIGIMGLGINELIIYIFTDLLLLYYLYSKIASTIVVFFWNFLVRRFSLFKA